MVMVLNWILECDCLCSVPHACSARRYGGIPVWLGDFGGKGVLEDDHLGFPSLPQAAYHREGDGVYVFLSH